MPNARYVCPAEDDDVELAPCQDIQGRLWDALSMAAAAMRRARGDSFAAFDLCVRENVPVGSGRQGRLRRVTLWVTMGGDEHGLQSLATSANQCSACTLP